MPIQYSSRKRKNRSALKVPKACRLASRRKGGPRTIVRHVEVDLLISAPSYLGHDCSQLRLLIARSLAECVVVCRAAANQGFQSH
jgi:hypothetical protein